MKKYLLLLILVLGFLRIINLGYSEYILDEGVVMDTLKQHGGFSWEFLLNQRKGPMQFFVSLLPYFITNNLYNEFIFRLPYALASILSIYFFYKFVKSFTADDFTSLISTFLFGVNGFMIAFGRMVQYQSLNLLFSTICLYLFSEKKYILGTAFFSLSLLSHWDAILILPILIYMLITNFKIKYVAQIFFVGVVTLSPFMIPYISNYISNEDNKAYFSSRIDRSNLGITENLEEYKFKTELYNPFVFMGFILIFSTISFLNKKSYPFLIWFGSIFIVFILFVKKPGTHVYNMFIPLSILCALGIRHIYNFIPLKRVYIGIIFLIFGFLYYQQYLIFVDTKKEYPFEREKILYWETKEYTHKNLTNNIIGFLHFRDWEQINNKLKEFGATSYYTNELTSLTNFYMDIPHSNDAKYLVGIKRPVSFMTDYKLSNIKGKSTIYELYNKYGETVGRIYLKDE